MSIKIKANCYRGGYEEGTMTPKCCEHGGVYRVVDKCGCVLFEELTGLQHDLCGECKIQMKDDAVREARKMERALRCEEQRRETKAAQQLERDMRLEEEPGPFRKFLGKKQKRKPSPFIGSFDQLPHHPTPEDLRSDEDLSRSVPQDRGCGKRTPMHRQILQAQRDATLSGTPVVSQLSVSTGNRIRKKYLTYNPARGGAAPVDERTLSWRAKSETAPPTLPKENDAVISSASVVDQALYRTSKVDDTFFPPWTMARGIHPGVVKPTASAAMASEDA
ncbi:uncharacterized protein E0L32_004274 [Thyridium curvatum]|uniref:Uncharacterized protein n=1 Tax=Thyridium curvatum TaxID=1093900 RepID=A0A507B8V1_9PEZI|nr:uncharacterized protein E0L32_004274 [Thyridium curvatum]TPX15576.1 hypothetical protein E0L32_004274 [Thyridium curvatum]